MQNDIESQSLTGQHVALNEQSDSEESGDGDGNQLLSDHALDVEQRQPLSLDDSSLPLNTIDNIDNHIEMAELAQMQVNELLSERNKKPEKMTSEKGSIATDLSDHPSVDTLDNFVGPVREEFDDLKRKIDERENQLHLLEKEYY